MDPLALFFSAQGRLPQKPFWLSLFALYVLSFASLLLLSGAVTARAGVMAFATAQAALLWAWTMVHIKRLRDAGRPAAGAISVALLYGLSLALALLLVWVVTGSSVAVPSGESAPPQSAFAVAVLIAFILFLFDPSLGGYTVILKALALIACLPFVLSLTFSLYTGLRRAVP
jgi:uncharacterized membrane protein YhaH (DUF805 family)